MWLTDWLRRALNSLVNPDGDDILLPSTYNGLPIYSVEDLDPATTVALRGLDGRIYAYQEVPVRGREQRGKRPRSSSSSRSRSRSRTHTRHHPWQASRSSQPSTHLRSNRPRPQKGDENPVQGRSNFNSNPNARPLVGNPPVAAFTSPPITASVWDTTAFERMASTYGWNYWPDGPWSHTYQSEMGAFRVHWAFETRGARGINGSPKAVKWQDGKRTERRCLGYMGCANTECVYVGRPKTRASTRRAQVQAGCPLCGGSVTQVGCGVVSRYWIFAGGAHYDNGGFHNHPKPVHCRRRLG
ncbi:hypothetical protein C8F01DRAFT_1111611 [Mycena amicta]|nr:hypothetical protein C8F01DRAFT_1111611 [Mycena amicta]